MERKITVDLYNWFHQSDRKPLVIRGARQVGKTWLVRYFAKNLNLQLLELNFERDSSLKSLFKTNDVQKIYAQLEAFFNKDIDRKRALLFLDEIQAAPKLLAKLRWFAEELPELAVIATGSLLDFILEKYEHSMPVGRISYLHLESMSFEEFLYATDHKKLCDFLSNYQLAEEIPRTLHDRLQELLREYIFIGGLPAIVKNWVQNRSLIKVSEVQQNILTTYREDFAKYATRMDPDRLTEVFRTAPRLLGKKFKYSAVNKDIHSASIKKALDLLCKARICHKVFNCTGDGIPLAAGIKENIFKIILLDVGLVSAAMGLTLSEMIKLNELRLINESGLAEQLVGQLLRIISPNYIDPSLYYWSREKTGVSAEVDYLIQHQAQIVPLEVKAGSTGKLRSLHAFMKLRNLNKAVRLNSDYPSMTPIEIQDTMGEFTNYQLISIPIYLTEQLHRLLDET